MRRCIIWAAMAGRSFRGRWTAAGELKLKKAAGFAAVTETEGCFRESLLAYFNEQKKPPKTDETACCTSCGLSLEAYEVKGDRPSMNKLTAWEEELDTIFAASCDRVC